MSLHWLRLLGNGFLSPCYQESFNTGLIVRRIWFIINCEKFFSGDWFSRARFRNSLGIRNRDEKQKLKSQPLICFHCQKISYFSFLRYREYFRLTAIITWWDFQPSGFVDYFCWWAEKAPEHGVDSSTDSRLKCWATWGMAVTADHPTGRSRYFR